VPNLKRILGVSVLVLFPLASALLALPIAANVLPYEVRTGEFHAAFWVIGVAFLGGLIAAPGYICAASSTGQIGHLSPLGRVWIRASLLVGFVAAVMGLVATLLAFWPLAVFPLGTAVICLLLRLRCRKVWSAASQ
jgi:hypothetical protein